MVAPTSARGPSRSATRGAPAIFSQEGGVVVTAAENSPGRDLGAQPCELCGQWTHSWCEACSLRPFNAVCTQCDADHLICRPCQRLGRSWEAARAANTTPPDCIELSGYHDQTGRFVQVEPRTPRSASHWRTCHQMAPSTPPSWPRWSPPCLRSGQRSESLPDAGCHLDVHMVTNCMSHTMNSSLQILCGRRFAEARQV